MKQLLNSVSWHHNSAAVPNSERTKASDPYPVIKSPEQTKYIHNVQIVKELLLSNCYKCLRPACIFVDVIVVVLVLGS